MLLFPLYFCWCEKNLFKINPGFSTFQYWFIGNSRQGKIFVSFNRLLLFWEKYFLKKWECVWIVIIFLSCLNYFCWCQQEVQSKKYHYLLAFSTSCKNQINLRDIFLEILILGKFEPLSALFWLILEHHDFSSRKRLFLSKNLMYLFPI